MQGLGEVRQSRRWRSALAVNWNHLADLRSRGQRPGLLCVTTDFGRCRAQADAGAMVVVHKPGERLPVELLDGLNVELHLDDCSQAFRLARAWKAQGVEPALCSSWCRCERRMSICVPKDCLS